MASNSSHDFLSVVDNLFSIKNRLQMGRPPPPLDFWNESLKDVEPAPNSVTSIDPKCISRCCIESGKFPTVPLFFKFSCGEAT